MLRTLTALLAAIAAAITAAAEPVHRDVDGGYYLAEAPPDWDGATRLPLIVYFHGWNSTPEGTFRNRAMIDAAHKRGALFVSPWAPNGYWHQMGEGRGTLGRDEAAFTRSVMANVLATWPVDPDRTLASGFSRGGSMVWNVACYTGDLFAGYAPIAGGFWRSTPTSCPSGPQTMRHIHGLSDRVVAWDEVGVYNSRPIPEGLAMVRAQAGCGPETTDRAPEQRLTCSTRACAGGTTLSVCLHEGGHSIPAEWVAMGLDWLDGLRRDPEIPVIK